MNKIKKAGCIIEKENKILLSLYKSLNYWNIPKGHVEEGETFEQAAKREMKEEIGCEVEVKGKAGVVSYKDVDEDDTELVVFYAKIISGSPRPETDEYELVWMTKKEAIEIVTYNEMKDFIKSVNGW